MIQNCTLISFRTDSQASPKFWDFRPEMELIPVTLQNRRHWLGPRSQGKIVIEIESTVLATLYFNCISRAVFMSFRPCVPISNKKLWLYWKIGKSPSFTGRTTVFSKNCVCHLCQCTHGMAISTHDKNGPDFHKLFFPNIE